MRKRIIWWAGIAVVAALLVFGLSNAEAARNSNRGRNNQEAAPIDMTVERHGYAGCDMIVTTNHFTLARGESSDPITVDLSMCEDMEWLSIFGYLTTNNSSRTFKDGSNMLVTVTNEDTGTTATSYRPDEDIIGGRVMIGDVDWVIISGVLIQEAVPNFASFFVTNQSNKKVTVRLSSVVHFE